MDQTSPIDLTLASYNIRAGLGVDLRRDPIRSLKTIHGLDADIVTLQEADFRLGHRPTALPRETIGTYTDLTPIPVAENDHSLGWHGVAILARPNLAHTDIHRIPLPGLEPRGAVVVDFNVGFRLVAVHLGLLRRDRRAQMAHIRTIINELDNRPTVMMGDFNEWSTRKGFEPLTDFNVLTAGKTFPSRLPLGHLDRLVHCDRCTLTPMPIPTVTGAHASDHLPIKARLNLSGGS